MEQARSHHQFVTSILLQLSNVNSRHFYFIALLIHIVRCPCCETFFTVLYNSLYITAAYVFHVLTVIFSLSLLSFLSNPAVGCNNLLNKDVLTINTTIYNARNVCQLAESEARFVFICCYVYVCDLIWYK